MRNHPRRFTKKTLLTAFRESHNDRYRYPPLPEEFTFKTKIVIICPVHGEFTQTIEHHLAGQGCRKCHDSRRAENMSLGRDEWIRRFESVHGRGKYNYSRVPDNMLQKMKLEIYCPEHDTTFRQTPIQHWKRKQGCPECGHDKHRKSIEQNMVTRQDFERKARAVHGVLFEYLELPSEFSLNDTVIIYCNIHAHAFFCKAKDHLKRKGCGMPV